MKKTLNAFGIVLAMLACLAFASPVLACGGKKSKSDKSTTAQKDKESKSDKKAKSDSDESKDKSEDEPTKS